MLRSITTESKAKNGFLISSDCSGLAIMCRRKIAAFLKSRGLTDRSHGLQRDKIIISRQPHSQPDTSLLSGSAKGFFVSPCIWGVVPK
ncbi:hypothetical protein L596_030717 [Steinernema carpocapsae]|uniref:Uncharacterized protein n=1 Tax=Steinernema carpocapsae TaxID=34508 RepID=A0A4U5LNM0_STECR|nr:hypothetical protein L596_030717 [Steinernema carpocapsae]